MAYCSSCSSNNCSCTSYTLPTGSTGATGATGATGPAGTPGAVIIADIIVGQDSTTSGSYETLYTYSLPASTLDEAGDQLGIIAYWSCSAANAAGSLKPLQIQVGGNTLTGAAKIGGGAAYVVQEYYLSMVTATTVAVNYQTVFSNFLGFTTGQAHIYHYPNKNTAGYQAVSSLASAQNIIFQVTSAASGDVTLDRIVILKLEKV